jgi:hypothetical protein
MSGGIHRHPSLQAWPGFVPVSRIGTLSRAAAFFITIYTRLHDARAARQGVQG